MIWLFPIAMLALAFFPWDARGREPPGFVSVPLPWARMSVTGVGIRAGTTVATTEYWNLLARLAMRSEDKPRRDARGRFARKS